MGTQPIQLVTQFSIPFSHNCYYRRAPRWQCFSGGSRWESDKKNPNRGSRFSDAYVTDEYDETDGFGFRNAAKQGMRWFDDLYAEDDDEDEGFAILEGSIGFNWFFKVHQWVQEAFPAGGDYSGLVVIYEQCVRTFWHDERYKDDLRYMKVWLEYAENCADAEVVYNFLEANKIGVTHASFYISYALHMEQKNKSKTANEIFNRGLSMKAQPDEALTSAYKKFLVRSMRQLKATDEEVIDNQVPARSFGTVLAKNAGNQVSESSDIFRKKQKLDRTPGTTFSIFKDNGSSSLPGPQPETSKLHKTTPWHSLGARAERNKENNAIPSKWTSNKIPQRPGVRPPRPAPGPCIEIFVDEECTDLFLWEGEDAVCWSESSKPGRYYFRCPDFGNHKMSFIWCDRIQSNHSNSNLYSEQMCESYILIGPHRIKFKFRVIS